MKRSGRKHAPGGTTREVTALVKLLLALLTTAGLACTSADSTPPTMSLIPGGEPAAPISPDYPRNAAGQTYGSSLFTNSPALEPDLILVRANNGKIGYVEKAVLDSVSGANFTSPEEALAWQEARRPGDSIDITVYASDGSTIVGSFTVGL